MNLINIIITKICVQFPLWGIVFAAEANTIDFWNMERPKEMANIKNLEVMCGKTYMEVQISFDKIFNGIIFSKGAVNQYNCIYVKPQTGSSTYSFNIMYDQCGTKPDMNGKFYENNIVIQYDKDLIEVWDEAKRLRCEWYNDYEKGITKPPIRVSDLEVVELNFRGDNVDCWMEIQHGKGPWANLVNGIVPLGTTLTMVIGIKDKQGEFDMRVKSCSAEAKNSRPIHLTDEHGCVLRPKMISKFMKIANADNRASVLTYAFFHAFKFPDSMTVNIKCKVEICRFGCPDHCQKPDKYMAREGTQSLSVFMQNKEIGPRFEARRKLSDGANLNVRNMPLRENLSQKTKKYNRKTKRSKNSGFFGIKFPKISEISNIFNNPKSNNVSQVILGKELNSHVPLHRNNKVEQPLVYSTLNNAADKLMKNEVKGKYFPQGPRGLIVNNQYIHFRKKRNTEEMGVKSGYEVISEVDLAFKANFEKGIGVTVFQGRMLPEEVVYGVCIPATGFSALFVILSLFTVLSVLIAGFVCYHRQLRKSFEEGAPTLQLRNS